MIENALCDILNSEDRTLLDHYLDMLPAELIQHRPFLLMMKAWSLQLSWQIGKIPKILSQVEALIEEDDGVKLTAETIQVLLGQILLLRAQEAWLGNQPSLCVENCEKVKALMPSSWTYVRGGAILYWSLGMGALGKEKAIEQLLLKEYKSLDDKTTAYSLRFLQSLCFNYINTGNLVLARQTANIFFQQAVRGGKVISQYWAHFFLGLVSYHWNDLEDAYFHFGEVIKQPYMGQSFCVHLCYQSMALVHQARGEDALARKIVDSLSRFQVENEGQEHDEVHSLHARLMLGQGNEDRAFQWADAFSRPVENQPLFWVEVPHISRARILLERNGNEDNLLALDILDELLEIAERTHNIYSKIHILALRTLALDALGHGNDSIVALQEAVALAQSGSFLRVFIDLRPRMEGLLKTLAKQSSNNAYIDRILAAFADSYYAKVTENNKPSPVNKDQSTTKFPVLIEPLTPRELGVLKMLGEPKSPREIAGELNISYTTVKRHTINIYAKLDVQSRWDAVNKAIQLGILPAG